MRTLDFCREHVTFTRPGSPVTGPFRDEFYPFLRAPFNASDDIEVKRVVFLKASSSMGTLGLQCILAKRIVCDVGDILFIAQSDDDASKFSKTRGKSFMATLPNATRLLSRDKYAITNNLWQYRDKFVAIEGPGQNNQNSVQTATVITDESHTDAYLEGALAAFEKRAGGKWNRKIIHATTAANVDKEVSGFYYEGDQNEWHLRCPKCAELIFPIWSDTEDKRYNGERVFCFDDVTAAPTLVCPYCQYVSHDTARDRYALNRDGDYLPTNPSAPKSTRSFRWPVWAMHPISWDGLLLEYRAAIASAKLGNLKPHEDWIKKRECRPYQPSLLDYGSARGAADYYIGENWNTPDSIKVMTSDPQAGKAGEAPHRHALVTQWTREGESRRLCYRKIDSAAQLHEMALEFGVREGSPGVNPCVMVDSGHEPRRTFRECGQFGWYAFRGSDLQQFHTLRRGNETITHAMPYSMPEPQSGIVGEEIPKGLKRVNGGRLPHGWAFCIVGSNPELYSYLSALLGGASGRYFGIAKDFSVEYTSNMPAFIRVIEKDKKTQLDKEFWRKVREDHYWDLEVMALVIAMKHGYFPLGKIPAVSTIETTATA